MRNEEDLVNSGLKAVFLKISRQLASKKSPNEG